MASVWIERTKLLETLRTNRDNHQAIFEEALEGYRKAAVEYFNEQIDNAKAGKEVAVYFPHHRPQNMKKSYDTVIQMLEMTEDEKIKLGEGEFANYVNDDWDWKKNWAASNSGYVSGSTYTALTASMGDDD